MLNSYIVYLYCILYIIFVYWSHSLPELFLYIFLQSNPSPVASDAGQQQSIIIPQGSLPQQISLGTPQNPYIC